jgi:DNA-binding response OmpR family regulator
MTQPSVLLVDDDRLVLDLYALALRQHGFAVQEAADAVTARALVRSGRPELACIDGRLVSDSGHELAREIAAEGVRVVLFTNDQNLFDRPPAGVALRLIKVNTSPRQLAAELTRLLETRAGEPTSNLSP